MRLGTPIALDCPECGRIRWVDEDGLCSMCGSDCSWIYQGVRLSPEGQPITRAQWYRIVAERAREYGAGEVTPALAQVCKTKSVTNGPVRIPGACGWRCDGADVKRTSLRRYTRLQARKPMRQRNPKRKPRGELDDPAYLAYLRAQPCRAPGLPPHAGDDPHHVRHQESGGGIGARLKAHDHRAISLCRRCHGDLHALAGAFRGWTGGRLREWLEVQIAKQRADYLRGAEKSC